MKIITVQSRGGSDAAAQVIVMLMAALGFVINNKRQLTISYDALARSATLECNCMETLKFFKVYGTSLLGDKIKRYYWSKEVEGHLIHPIVFTKSEIGARRMPTYAIIPIEQLPIN